MVPRKQPAPGGPAPRRAVSGQPTEATQLTADDAPRRTRGGWTPVGTSADRRAAHSERGTARGERTRRQIIDAARRVFERDDYLTVGVADIAREAGVAHGSFYTYFSSKLEVFRVICEEVSQAVDDSVRSQQATTHRLDPVEALSSANQSYVETYHANARIYAMMSRLEHIDAELLQANLNRQQRHFRRVADQISRWQGRGVADPSVDPFPTAATLVLAIANVCYWLFEKNDRNEAIDVTRHVAAVNDVWIRALDLRRTPNPDWLS